MRGEEEEQEEMTGNMREMKKRRKVERFGWRARGSSSGNRRRETDWTYVEKKVEVQEALKGGVKIFF